MAGVSKIQMRENMIHVKSLDLPGRPILIFSNMFIKIQHLYHTCTFPDNTIQPIDNFWVRVRPKIAECLVRVRPIIAEYLEVTTIHGLRYLMECKTILEKLFWLLIICFSFGYSTYIIQSFFDENENKPILTTIETGLVQDVPFPAITIRYSLHQIWRKL